jgi:hypothetical protein
MWAHLITVMASQRVPNIRSDGNRYQKTSARNNLNAEKREPITIISCTRVACAGVPVCTQSVRLDRGNCWREPCRVLSDAFKVVKQSYAHNTHATTVSSHC